MSRKLKKLETYNALFRSKYFDILNGLGLDHDCDGQTDRQNSLAIAHSNIARVRHVLTRWVNSLFKSCYHC